MAREILFKAKRISDGKWIEGYLVKCRTSEEEGYAIKDTVYHVNDGIINLIPCVVDESTICQYTGLTDKNGNKIWENDLVQIDAYSYIECEEDAFGVLEYSDAYASFGLSLEDRFARICDLQGSYTTIYEVLGNIFDNPELLGGADNG